MALQDVVPLKNWNFESAEKLAGSKKAVIDEDDQELDTPPLSLFLVPIALAFCFLRSAILLHKSASSSVVVRDGATYAEGASYANATLVKRDQHRHSTGLQALRPPSPFNLNDYFETMPVPFSVGPR
ncbi:MAG: hypothetical protein M1826_006733 [Phylliscum demangeonii]|nr:MAG: hypothetical protein M1826_006733 [Phylliscum demangeonii]